ncbi:MAG: response regulator [Verrucomicrobia bacterium]|nr:response regulator [Verrucomicrobiota bacterium]
MKILIADDSAPIRSYLSGLLRSWGHELVIAKDGEEAWRLVQLETPQLAVFDWVMPGLEGPELCQRVRADARLKQTYVILLTSLSETEDIVAGLNSGANDFVTKPFNESELRARINVGVRVVELQAALAARIGELERALAENSQLRGLLPICAYCKSVRNDNNYWLSVERYFGEHTEVQFTHGICPKCMETVVKPELAKLYGDKPQP